MAVGQNSNQNQGKQRWIGAKAGQCSKAATTVAGLQQSTTRLHETWQRPEAYGLTASAALSELMVAQS